MYAPEHPTGICLKIGLSTLSQAPYVSIDDDESDQLITRDEFFPVGPGWHKVRCFVRAFYFFFPIRLGDSSINVLVEQGCVVSLMWRWRGIQRGKFEIEN